MDKRQYAVLISILAVACAITLRLIILSDKVDFIGDEVISLLSITGKQEDCVKVLQEKTPPYAVWAPAEEWKDFWRFDDIFCFNKIRRGLAHKDIHPPLYFWVLHLWSAALGLNMWSGVVLNLLIDLIIMFLLYRFLSYIFADALWASIGIFIWGVSPSVIEASFLIRQYSLLGLWAICLVWQSLKITDAERCSTFKDFLLLALWAGAGLLTHFQFILVIAFCALWFILTLVKHNRKQMVFALLSLCAGGIILLVFNPDMFDSMQRQQLGRQAFSFSDLPYRFACVILAFLPGRTQEIFVKYPVTCHIAEITFLLLLILLISLTGICFKKRNIFINVVQETDIKIKYVCLAFVFISGSIILMYLSFLSAEHAMGGRYLFIAWPFAAAVLTLFLRALRKCQKLITFLACFMFLFSSFSFILLKGYFSQQRQAADPVAVLQNIDRIILDNSNVAVLGKLLWHIRPDVEVFVASQKDLLENSSRWTNELDEKTLYVSNISYKATKQGQKRILEIIRQTHSTIPVKGGIWGSAEVFTLRKIY